jgi:hypothetical protein
MELWQTVLALVSIMIFFCFFLFVAAIAAAVIFGSVSKDCEKYEMDEETFDRIKEAQYLQMNNLFGNYL